MSDSSKPGKDAFKDLPGLAAIIADLGTKSQTAVALVSAAALEQALEVLLLTKMRPLSNTKAEDIFSGYGPLASFSAKTDIAYAFELIDDGVYADLRTIKSIRNAFAHAVETTHFHSDEIKKLIRRFEGWNGRPDPMVQFKQRAEFCLAQIRSVTETLLFASAVEGDDEPAT